MRSFSFLRAGDGRAAVQAAAPGGTVVTGPPTEAPGQFIAGGTTILDLMKLDVMHPQRLVDITALAQGSAIEATPTGLHLGAQVRMAQAAGHPAVRRDYPLIADTLLLAASPQLRNMASLGGNLLQRTRCAYFRETAFSQCNKRAPGSGCAALEGLNRQHAVLGTSDACIATYPGDFAQALMALDASVQVMARDGTLRTLPMAQLHRLPGSTPHVETALAPGELITAIDVPAGAWTRRSLYLKVRDRQSYQFALASAAVALDLQGDVVRQARIALGGVATVPWRAPEAEAALSGKILNEASAEDAARLAFADARPRGHNDYKVALGQQTLVRALLQARQMKV